jgi:hypothetical protein
MSNLKKGKEFLTKALELFKDDNRIMNHFWLGFLHYDCRETEQAVPHFRICMELIKEAGYEIEELWPVQLMLGKTYLMQNNYDECEKVLVELNKSMGPLSNQQNRDKKVGNTLLFPTAIGNIAIDANLLLASVCLEKRYCGVEVEDKIFESEKILKSISENEDSKNLKASICDSKGWLKCLQVQRAGANLISDSHLEIKSKSNTKLLKAIIEKSHLVVDEGFYCFKGGEIKNAIIQKEQSRDLNIQKAFIRKIKVKREAKIKGIVIDKEFKRSYISKSNNISKGEYMLEEAEIESAELDSGSIRNIFLVIDSLSAIEESISWLEESLALSADPQTCLHLAQALEIKLELTSDSKIKEAIKKQIVARCKLANQLDIMEDYKEDIEAISKKYEEKKETKEEPKEKLTPVSTLSLSIEGTAKGEIASKAESKEKGSEKK